MCLYDLSSLKTKEFLATNTFVRVEGGLAIINSDEAICAIPVNNVIDIFIEKEEDRGE